MNRSCFLRETCPGALGQLKNSILLQLPQRKELFKEIQSVAGQCFGNPGQAANTYQEWAFSAPELNLFPPPASPQNVVYGEIGNKPSIQERERGNIICYREVCNICIINMVRDGLLQRDDKLWVFIFVEVCGGFPPLLCKMLTCGSVITLSCNVVYVFWGFRWWRNSPWWLSLKWELTTVVSTSPDLNNKKKRSWGNLKVNSALEQSFSGDVDTLPSL